LQEQARLARDIDEGGKISKIIVSIWINFFINSYKRRKREVK